MDQEILRLEQVFSEDPGDPSFADLADRIRRRKDYSRALQICLEGLTANPSCHVGRLILARVYYDQGLYPFAIREVRELCRTCPDVKSLSQLERQLNPDAEESLSTSAPEGGQASSGSQEDQVIAEADFDFDELEMMSEDE